MPITKSSRGFTLIELLIVIAIIGILMALLFPAVSGAMDGAKRAQAKNDVTQIATAITAYETEYGYLPSDGSSSGSDKTVNADSNGVIGALMGTTTNNNPRKIVFLEVANVTGKKGKSGMSNTSFVDPWGNVYQITLDYDYDNSITNSAVGTENSAGTTNVALRKKVAVFNITTSKSGKNDKEYFRHVVTSW